MGFVRNNPPSTSIELIARSQLTVLVSSLDNPVVGGITRTRRRYFIGEWLSSMSAVLRAALRSSWATRLDTMFIVHLPNHSFSPLDFSHLK